MVIGAYIVGLIVMFISMWVSNKLKSKFEEFSKIHLSNGMSGEEIAKRMLADYGITDVSVKSISGRLTDHYSPKDKIVNLSQAVFGERNAAAAAVAAHEVGHAVQHATAYKWLSMRSNLVPIVSISSKFMQWVLLAGILLVNTFPAILGIGIVLFSLTTLFSLITLPVEYDASHRAIKWMQEKNIVTNSELVASKESLTWAARTYLVAAIGSIATLLYYLSFFLNRRR